MIRAVPSLALCLCAQAQSFNRKHSDMGRIHRWDPGLAWAALVIVRSSTPSRPVQPIPSKRTVDVVVVEVDLHMVGRCNFEQ